MIVGYHVIFGMYEFGFPSTRAALGRNSSARETSSVPSAAPQKLTRPDPLRIPHTIVFAGWKQRHRSLDRP
jgi:hypothetical protein